MRSLFVTLTVILHGYDLGYVEHGCIIWCTDVCVHPKHSSLGFFSVLLFQHCYSLEGLIIPIRRNHAIGKTQIIQLAAKCRDYNSNLFPKQHKNS